MNKLVEIGIKETANKLGVEEKLVKQIVLHYFSCLYLEMVRGIRNIKLQGFFTIKKTVKHESFRSKFQFGTKDSTRNTGSKGI